MSNRYNAGRQEIIASVQKIGDATGITEIEDNDKVGELPEGAIVTGGFVRVAVANGALLTADIGIVGDLTKYATAADMNAVADTAITVPVEVVGSGGESIIVSSVTGVPGVDLEAYVVIEYVEVGRAAFSQG